ncbi:unnamed protein product [Lymnaea stagnalis]|uniref:acid phosphatase n=1 Tax=Lymnaea stagnalis TaxID=6523 RepID=A0AAV2H5R6_LYMST
MHLSIQSSSDRVKRFKNVVVVLFIVLSTLGDFVNGKLIYEAGKGNRTFYSSVINDDNDIVSNNNDRSLLLSKRNRAEEENPSTSTLVLVQVVHRHGDRGPVHTYPKDPNKDRWPQGLGQLTTKGMLSAYKLGQFLLQRYEAFLGNRFNHSQMHYRSTDYDRTLMTAECVAAGLFPLNISSEDWPLGLWQPIPVHSVPEKMDKLLRPSSSCQYVKDLRSAIKASFASSRLMMFEKELMLNLSRSTGMDINITTLHDLADVIFCQKNHDMKQPEWLSPEIETELFNYKSHQELVSPEDAKYLAGTLFQTLIRNMENKMSSSSDSHKLIMFSAHESPVRFTKALLGVDDRLEVPYTGALIAELHRMQGNYFVKFLYRNTKDEPLITFLVKYCKSELCPYKEFHKAYQDLIVTDEEWDDVCSAQSTPKHSTDDSWIPYLVAALVILIAVVIFLGYKVYSLQQQIRQGPSQDEYALLMNRAETSDSENEMEMEDTLSGVFSQANNSNTRSQFIAEYSELG